VGYEYRKLKDDVRATATVTEKHAHVGTLSAFGDARDGLGGGGLTQATVMLSQGQLGFDSPGAEAIDAQGAKTAGSYSKVHLSAERQQRFLAGSCSTCPCAGSGRMAISIRLRNSASVGHTVCVPCQQRGLG
jgi:hypothetical protein